ncbi:MAG TPA: hypothetical protein VHP11_07090 [Tepidisphaeraceae bacterium]|nr:hypothetical protein [Tepidisphaeraceae bacterium]
MQRLANAPERFNAYLFADPDFIAAALRIARYAIAVSALSAGILLALILVARRRPAVITAVLALAIIELTAFALIARGTMPNRLPFPAEWAAAMQDNPQQRRCINKSMRLENLAMSLGTYDVWGYDPGVLRRYGQLITASQAQDPDRATQYVRFQNLRNTLHMLRMLRLGWIFAMDPEPAMMKLDDGLPQAQLIGSYQVIPYRDQMFSRMFDKSFDPAHVVFLEQDPGIPSGPSVADGSVAYTPLDTDRSRIEVQTSRPAILLITENFASGWTAKPLSGSSQQSYTILPANYCLRAIPLQPGKHDILMEYSPASYALGRWTTAFAATAYLVGLIVALRRERKLEPNA